jgi:hypothetical protein
VVFIFVFVLLAIAMTLLFWGGGMVLQGWFYQNPADNMPIRAAIGGALLAAFLTVWCFIDARAGGNKYTTLFAFSPEEIVEYEAFDAVMRNEKKEERLIHFERRSGTGANWKTEDFHDKKNLEKTWKKSTADEMCVAILIKDKESPEPWRFEANLDKDGQFPKEASDLSNPMRPKTGVHLRYTDPAGRYMTSESLGRVYRKKVGVLFANLFLNGAHLILWIAVMWFVLRFSLGHALVIGFAMWLFMMLAVQPELFIQTRPKETAQQVTNELRYARSNIPAAVSA